MKARRLSLPTVDRGVRAAWTRLAAEAVEPNPYFEPAAVEPAVALLPDGARAELLVVEEAGELLLAVPVLPRSRHRGVPVPALAGWAHDYCFLGTPLAREVTLAAAWGAVLDAGLRCPWLSLDRTAVDGPVVAGLTAALRARGRRPVLLDAFDRPVLVRRPVADYLDGRLSARHAKTLRRQRRRLDDALGHVARVDLAASGAGAGLDAAVGLLLAQEASGWKGRQGTALASSPAHAEYFRRVCQGFAEQGRLQLWSLRGERGSAATQSNLLAQDGVFHFKIGYDDQHASCSPGLQLELEMVEEFHLDHRHQRIDSGTGPGQSVSARLYPDRIRLATVLVPLDGVASRLALGGAVVEDRARRSARWFRDALGRRA